jgi:hypothetical protein
MEDRMKRFDVKKRARRDREPSKTEIRLHSVSML